MTPFWAFIIGAFLSGTVLAVVFGAFALEAEEKAYRKGYLDGVRKAHEEFKEVMNNGKVEENSN